MSSSFQSNIVIFRSSNPIMIRPSLGFLICMALSYSHGQQPRAWIRVNQLGYAPNGLKAAVLATKTTLMAIFISAIQE
jgi:hypothetical protein